MNRNDSLIDLLQGMGHAFAGITIVLILIVGCCLIFGSGKDKK